MLFPQTVHRNSFVFFSNWPKNFRSVGCQFFPYGLNSNPPELSPFPRGNCCHERKNFQLIFLDAMFPMNWMSVVVPDWTSDPVWLQRAALTIKPPPCLLIGCLPVVSNARDLGLRLRGERRQVALVVADLDGDGGGVAEVSDEELGLDRLARRGLDPGRAGGDLHWRGGRNDRRK